jgi:2-hydroxy-3-keto-5-methylthiopentenyl-1-phosphate phosphatase
VIGDSLSDLGVAQQADWVFATGTLQQDLDRLNVAYTPFTDFKTVQQALAPLLKQPVALAPNAFSLNGERSSELINR